MLGTVLPKLTIELRCDLPLRDFRARALDATGRVSAWSTEKVVRRPGAYPAGGPASLI